MAEKEKDPTPSKDKTATIDLSHTSKKDAGQKGETKDVKIDRR